MNLTFKNLLQASAIMLIGFFTGHLLPKSKAATLSKSQHELVYVGFDELKKIVAEKTAWIIDARAAHSFQEGHIPGATNLPAGCSDPELKDFIRAATNAKKPVVLYCSDAACPDSHGMAVRLSRDSDLKIMIYKEGWEEWKILEPTS